MTQTNSSVSDVLDAAVSGDYPKGPRNGHPAYFAARSHSLRTLVEPQEGELRRSAHVRD
jgi:hypothetical protein